ncbi:CDP-diacylglycerol--glycerol-3-phosphate 3-phosphatidyltransferase [Gracilinema caldarium]|uniref:CDP-diacylglycerol--glycerol-3-phosphate 3-phosphatidyltransferase n=1 Tax=Gracilinema caldarium (strain ATCC 51460 / DSM 7334 / H1) TaxID=744872 RepID=F8EYM9_GRAC1|nr:CDP-diacylglycerol--glycerol-3-phosphate 3-phosphatidyltransferase [Gracilinema caldarium]AEJ18606.1 CDP-diacylglycerol/glycerol-3-phosphate 3-phosphatidyltransferase [Gracilinema caldarium DSM 7334]
MTSADKITSIRLILAPIFFVVYFLPVWFPSLGATWTVPVLWVLFVIAELTDLFDGLVARSRNEVSDFGKLFDPFSDTLVRITYFLCFVVDGILPAILLMIVLYREFGILFLRTLMMKLGIAMGARSGGKMKAVTYMVAGLLALIASSTQRLSIGLSLFTGIKIAAIVVFIISVVLSLGSFVDYYRVYKNAKK